MHLDSLIDWIKLLFISCHARSKHFSTVWGFCSFCLARFLSVLLDTRMGLKRGSSSLENGWRKCHRQGILEMASVEKTNEFLCLWAQKAGMGRGCLLRGTWTGLIVRREKDLHPANLGRLDCSEGLIMWSAEHPALFQVTKPLRRRSEVSLKITAPASHKTDQSHQECSPWFQRALERSEVSRCTIPACETSCRKIRELCHHRGHSNIPALTRTQLLMKVVTRRCQKSVPLTPPPSCSFPSKNMNQALKRTVSEGWFSCDYCLGERLCLVFLQTALFAEQNTLGSCPIDTFLFKQQIQLQSEMQI